MYELVIEINSPICRDGESMLSNATFDRRQNAINTALSYIRNHGNNIKDVSIYGLNDAGVETRILHFHP